MNEAILNSGQAIPLLGIGTFTLTPEDCESTVTHALRSGYRSIDTANIYMNEKAVARGIRNSKVAREQIFLTSKLWPSDYGYEKASKAIDATLARLNTDSLELLLLHQPYGDYLGAWKAMEKAVEVEKIKTVGLSNFGEKELNNVLKHAKVPPAVLQVECHPYCQQKELKKTLAQYGIALEAWYPLGHGNKKLLQEPLFTQLASKYGKSVIQIILRWHIQTGNIVIPGSKTPSHIDENLKVFDFSLTEDEMVQIEALDKNMRFFRVPKLVQRIMFVMGHPDFEKQA